MFNTSPRHHQTFLDPPKLRNPPSQGFPSRVLTSTFSSSPFTGTGGEIVPLEGKKVTWTLVESMVTSASRRWIDKLWSVHPSHNWKSPLRWSPALTNIITEQNVNLPIAFHSPNQFFVSDSLTSSKKWLKREGSIARLRTSSLENEFDVVHRAKFRKQRFSYCSILELFERLFGNG